MDKNKKVDEESVLTRLLNAHAGASNAKRDLADVIRKLRGTESPVCYGLDDCSTHIMMACPWSIDCGEVVSDFEEVENAYLVPKLVDLKGSGRHNVPDQHVDALQDTVMFTPQFLIDTPGTYNQVTDKDGVTYRPVQLYRKKQLQPR